MTQYVLEICPDATNCVDSSWGYLLYAALLEQAPIDFADAVHRDGFTPVRQFLKADEHYMLWTVTLMNPWAEEALSHVLDRLQYLQLKRYSMKFTVQSRVKRQVMEGEWLFEQSVTQSQRHQLTFVTPTAFRSKKQHCTLPTMRLVIRSLIGSWNGAMADCPIEDEDDAGLNVLVEGLHCVDYSLRQTTYRLKGNIVPGFVGYMVIENRLSGFHRQLADGLLAYSGYAGIGMKTALGMGGVSHNILK